MRIQCESNVHRSRPHCILQNRIHACMLISSGHTSTQLPWRPHQICTLASHRIVSRVEQIRGTQCVAQRSTLIVGSRHERACHALFGPNAQLRDPDRNHLWKWTGINPDRIRIGQIRIQCGRTQTGFDPVQCALGVQCGRAFIYMCHQESMIEHA